MSEIRHDWLSDRWVIFAPERSRRPDEYDRFASPTPIRRVLCPFCPDNSDQTPPPVLTLPSNGENRARVRVVPNRYPALKAIPSGDLIPEPQWVASSAATLEACRHVSSRPSAAPAACTSADVLETLFHRRDLVGAHEIVIETPVHCASLTQIPLSDLVLVLEAYRSRLLHWRAHHGIQYAVIFKNVGPFAGASLVHAHSQLIATSFVPPDVQRVCARLDHFLREQGTGYWTSVVREELSRGDRMVAETDHFAVFCPFASPLPYSVTLIPKQPQSLFEEMPPRHHEELAEAIYRMLKSIELVLYQASYNYVLHTCPFDMQGGGGFQWRLEAFPRLTTQAGFELGSSCFINPVMPETAAAELRRAWRKEDRT